MSMIKNAERALELAPRKNLNDASKQRQTHTPNPHPEIEERFVEHDVYECPLKVRPKQS